MTEEEGHKLFERSEFLWPPKAAAEGGEPKAKFLGGLSFAYLFFGRQRKVRFLIQNLLTLPPPTDGDLNETLKSTILHNRPC